jgi:DNA-directed RNA polymerase specialized sigma24 family protein
VTRRLPSGVNRLPERVRLAAAIEVLPERDRQVLALRLVEQLTPLEAAGALKLTVREIEHRYATSLLLLARELGVKPSHRRAA